MPSTPNTLDIMLLKGLPLQQIPAEKGDVWFDDGSLLVNAETIVFRVHSSVLSMFSETFARMLQLPRFADCTDVPLLPLLDSAADTSLMLRAIYHHPNSGDPTDPSPPMPFLALSSLLRLGRKYKIVHLRDNVLSRLRAEYPSQFESMVRKPRQFAFIQGERGIHFKIIKLIKDAGLWSLLPYALYNILSFVDLETIFDGVDLDDGTNIVLSPDLQRICIIGHERLLRKMACTLFQWLDDVPVQDSCTQTHCCLEAFRIMREGIWRPLQNPYYALLKWDVLFAGLNPEELELCDGCDLEARAFHDQAREEIWDELPSMFDFGSWDELVDQELECSQH